MSNQTLILHIGPGKCASSTIQAFLASACKQAKASFDYEFIDPRLVTRLDKKENSAQDTLHKRLSTIKRLGRDTILSHEVLAQCPTAITKICRAAHALNMRTRVVGMFRPQFSHMKAIYGQWLFRAPSRLKEIRKTLLDYAISPEWFGQYEKFFIACVMTDYETTSMLHKGHILKFEENFALLKELLSPFSTEVVCGYLPPTGGRHELVHQFCKLARLEYTTFPEERAQKNKNTSFHPLLIEAVSYAIERNLLASLANPHTNNSQLAQASSIIKREMPVWEYNSDIEAAAQDYTADFFETSNRSFFRDYEIPEKILPLPHPNKKSELTKDAFLKLVRSVQEKRKADPEDFIRYVRTCMTACTLSITCSSQ
jgi:hypothetical protein